MIIMENNIDFRTELAKDILCSMVQGGYSSERAKHQAQIAVMYADALIEELNKNKQ